MNSGMTKTCLAVLFGVVLAATGLWASPASEEEPAAAMDKEMVMDPATGEMVTAPEYGGTFTYATPGEPAHVDSYLFSGAGNASGGVAEQLGIVNWAVDRDEYAFSSQYVPLEVAAGQLAES